MLKFIICARVFAVFKEVLKLITCVCVFKEVLKLITCVRLFKEMAKLITCVCLYKELVKLITCVSGLKIYTAENHLLKLVVGILVN